MPELGSYLNAQFYRLTLECLYFNNFINVSNEFQDINRISFSKFRILNIH